jgi:hypothetical protein
LLAAGELTAWIPSGGVWASPFTDLVWGFDALMLVETIVALMVAIVIGTPACEVGVWPELIGRLGGADAAALPRPICVIGLHFVDEWEARSRVGANAQEARGAERPMRRRADRRTPG